MMVKSARPYQGAAIISESDQRDRLAVERTHLANERTLLAYLRTALGLAAAGAGLIRFFSGDLIVPALGWLLVVAGLALTIFGVARFLTVRAALKSQEH